MAGFQQPYMYSAPKLDDDRFPATSFDPKAVTRASWNQKPAKPRKEGPLVSFNRHPDAHELLRGPRTPFKPFTPATASRIKLVRVVQLMLRVLELVAAAGVLSLMIVIDHVHATTAWVMRITAGLVILHCLYAVIHLARPAAARPPASAAAYQLFSVMADLVVIAVYAFGILSARRSSQPWGTLLSNKSLIKILLPSLLYTLISSGPLHFVSLLIGLWLAIKFRQITRMPPDFNPLEANLTARRHIKSRSSLVTTASTLLSETDKRLGTPLEELRRHSRLPSEDVNRHSRLPQEHANRQRSIPFYATRSSPRNSLGSATDLDLSPSLSSRQYHIGPAGTSPQQSPLVNSVNTTDVNRLSSPPPSPASRQPPVPPRSPLRASYSSYASYTQVPTQDVTDLHAPDASIADHVLTAPRSHDDPSRPMPKTVGSQHPDGASTPSSAVLPRTAKPTATWFASGARVNRQRPCERKSTMRQAYEALHRPYDDCSDSDPGSCVYGNDENNGGSLIYPEADNPDNDDDNDVLTSRHPNPLRSNPSLSNMAATATATATQAKSAGQRPSPRCVRNASAVLSDVDLNDGRVSGGGGERDAKKRRRNKADGLGARDSKRYTKWGGPRGRDSSIQREADFFSRPYGHLPPAATPPIMVGRDRQVVSSGNDYDGAAEVAAPFLGFGRRHVSGKAAADETLPIGWAL